MLNPCRTFFNLWKSISEKHLEYQLNIVTFEDDHRNILSTLEHLGKDFDFFVGTCSSRSWLSKCNFYPLGYHYLNVAVPYGHPLAGYKTIELSNAYPCFNPYRFFRIFYYAKYLLSVFILIDA